MNDQMITSESLVPEYRVSPQQSSPPIEEALVSGPTIANQPTGEETAIQSTLAGLVELVEGIRASFETKIKYDDVKARVIDELHRELQGCRDDLAFKLMRPLFIDLISMHDDMSSILRHQSATNDSSAFGANMLGNLQSFQSTIEDIMTRNGVEVFSEAGDLFVPGRQRATKMIPTEQPDLHMKVYDRLRVGFAYGNRVLRPEMVSVHCCAAVA